MDGKALRVGSLLLAGALLVFLAACRKGETPSPAKSSRVSATRAYRKYFGPAPTTGKGTCFAFVIFFPSAREQGKVVPFPFFTFDEATIEKVAMERFLGGMDVGSYRGEFVQPVAPGTHLLGVTREGGIVTVNFSKEILNGHADAKEERAFLGALTLTVSQFEGVDGVRVEVAGREEGRVNGKEVAEFLGHGGLRHQPLPVDERMVLEPGPPRLLSVTAVKDRGAKGVEDVSAYFDRPVEIREFSMSNDRGTPFAGTTFLSVFDMAAVLKPRDPSQFTAHMPIRVRWKVADKLGRRGEGDGVWHLEVKEH